MLHDSQQQRLLRAEVVMDQTPSDPGLASDVVHRSRLRAIERLRYAAATIASRV
jgi:hypothetical protein